MNIIETTRKTSNLTTENFRLKMKLRNIERAKKRRKNAIKQIIKSLIYILCLVIGIWFVASYFNVITHNLTDPSKIWSWNIFNVINNL